MSPKSRVFTQQKKKKINAFILFDDFYPTNISLNC